MTTTLMGLAKNRRSIRKFKEKPVPLESIMNILDSAHYAPSGANEQPWRFIIVKDEKIKKDIRKASEKGENEMYEKVEGDFKDWLNEQGLNSSKPFLEKAPVLIIVLMKRDAMYARESVWIAIGFILLALEEYGFCTVPYTPSNTNYPQEVLSVPKEFKLEAILPVGLSNDDSPRTTRMCLDSLVFYDNWGKTLDDIRT